MDPNRDTAHRPVGADQGGAVATPESEPAAPHRPRSSLATRVDRRGKIIVLVLALLWLVATAALDIATREELTFTALLCVAPVIAALALDVRETACVAAVAIVISVPLGLAEGGLTSQQHILDAAVVVLVSLLAVWVTALRSEMLKTLEFTDRLATYDALTGLLSRRATLEHGERIAGLRPDVRPPVALMLIDIDHFKSINDAHGHLVGDEVLTNVAEGLSHAFRGGDVVGRFGGEEFLAVLVGADRAEADTVAARILQLARESAVATSAGPIPVTVSIGLSALAPDEPDLSAALQRADNALYDSKRGGRARRSWRERES